MYKNNACEFKIYVFKNKEKTDVSMSYYANNIMVSSDVISRTFSTQYIFAITSEFFDENVNPERTKFDFDEDDGLSQSDMLDNVPHKNFHKELKQACLQIVSKNEPNLKKENEKKLEKLKKKYGYINFEDIDLNSICFDTMEIITSYRNELNNNEDHLIAMLENPKYSVEEVAVHVAEQNKHELAKYIFHRNLIASKGQAMVGSEENENTLHNLFFPQKTTLLSEDKTEKNLFRSKDFKLYSF